MTRREKTAAALILPGMALLCTEQLPATMAGVALLGAGAVLLNWAEARAYIKKKAARRPERQSKKDTPIFYPKKSKKSRHRTTI